MRGSGALRKRELCCFQSAVTRNSAAGDLACVFDRQMQSFAQERQRGQLGQVFADADGLGIELEQLHLLVTVSDTRAAALFAWSLRLMHASPMKKGRWLGCQTPVT